MKLPTGRDFVKASPNERVRWGVSLATFDYGAGETAHRRGNPHAAKRLLAGEECGANLQKDRRIPDDAVRRWCPNSSVEIVLIFQAAYGTPPFQSTYDGRASSDGVAKAAQICSAPTLRGIYHDGTQCF